MTISVNDGVNGGGVQGGGGVGTGTVTSVDLTAPSVFSVGGNPVTTAGTLQISYSGVPLPLANGGTGAATAIGARAALNLGSAAVLDASTDPTFAADSNSLLPTQAAVKDYVESLLSGLQYKEAVRVATTAAGTLATSFENGDTIDGVALATNDRILIKNQADQTVNGIYVVQASGAPARSTDADIADELVSATVLVTAGTANANTIWSCNSAAPITLGVTNITFAQIASAGVYTADESTLQLSGSQFSIKSGGVGTTQIAASVALTTPNLGTPTALVLTNATGGVVAGGGTGVAALTAYAPIFGGTTTTGAVQSGVLGIAGHVLTSNGSGALPTFQSAPAAGAYAYRGSVASEAAMVALISSAVGDTCLRSDLGTGGLRYELTAAPPTTAANWQPVQGVLANGSVVTVALVDGKLPRTLLVSVVSGDQVTPTIGGVTQPILPETVTGYWHRIPISDDPGATQPTTLTLQRTSGSGTTSAWSLEG